jgi:crotonobetainyl-CoA:carnitine CoA-transferase CaiB-like acyl-CoA transferase
VAAILKLTREGVGMELRRGTFDVMVDAQRVGSIELHDSLEWPVEPGRHTLRIRKGRYSSPEMIFDVADGQVANFRCHGAMMWPRYVASAVVPTMAISLQRE